MLEQLENQFSLMQQHQQQVHMSACHFLTACVVDQLYSFWFVSLLYQMRQQAATGGQPQNSLPNGPLAEPPHHHAGLANASPVNHSTNRPPCVTQPTANGSCSSSPSAGLPGHLDKNHALGLGGGGASNGNVPYLQQNSLPHNCTATSHPSTSSTTSSPSQADETWKSQQRNNSTQVFFWLSMFDYKSLGLALLLCLNASLFFPLFCYEEILLSVF